MKNPKGRPPAGSLARRDDLLEVLQSLAHKLSQPLTALRGTVEVGLMGEMDVKEYRRILEVSLQETQRMAEILEALRDIVEMERAGIQVRPVAWREIIEKALEEAASADKADRLRLISEATGEVWVTASPQRLSLATTRLIGGAVRAAREGHRVRSVLSVVEEIASLTVCDEWAPAAEEGANSTTTPGDSAKPLLGELEKWILSRAIECQGGRLSVRQISQTSRNYQMDLPAASPPVARTGRP
ncbi:MAG TPA: HAMP domain-containing sensor histidine kinase [Terriglobia bacterium]|nr:HAMP domain-containing sensor histidine kinase [Terriglobia bacterium]